MKYFVACLLLLCLGLVGCNKGPKTGWHCPDCRNPIAEFALECPNCNGHGNLDNLILKSNLQTSDEIKELKEEFYDSGGTRWNKN